MRSHPTLRGVVLRGPLYQYLLTRRHVRLGDTSFDKNAARDLESWGLVEIVEYKPMQRGRWTTREFLALRFTPAALSLGDAIREEFRQRNLAAPQLGEIDGWTCAAMREEWGHAEVRRVGGSTGISEGVRRTFWLKGTRRGDVKAALAIAFDRWSAEAERLVA